MQAVKLEKAVKAIWLMEVTLIKKTSHQGKGEIRREHWSPFHDTERKRSNGEKEREGDGLSSEK